MTVVWCVIMGSMIVMSGSTITFQFSISNLASHLTEGKLRKLATGGVRLFEAVSWKSLEDGHFPLKKLEVTDVGVEFTVVQVEFSEAKIQRVSHRKDVGGCPSKDMELKNLLQRGCPADCFPSLKS